MYYNNISLLGHNVTMHVTALEVLWHRLLDIGEQIPESQVISKILSTLPSSFRHFYTTWNNSPDTGKTVKLLCSLNFRRKKPLQNSIKMQTMSQRVMGLLPAVTLAHIKTPNGPSILIATVDQHPTVYHVELNKVEEVATVKSAFKHCILGLQGVRNT